MDPRTHIFTSNDPAADKQGAFLALSRNFKDAYILDLDTLEAFSIRHSPELDKSVNSAPAFSTYEEATRVYVEKNVFFDDQDRILEVLSPAGLVGHMGQSDSFVERFRVKRGEDAFQAYYLKCARIEDAQGRNRVVVAFSPENTFSYAAGYAASGREIRGVRDKRKVLVVEDSEINREVLTAILEDSYDVLTAENGRVGLELLAKHCQDISAVILDVYMPVCNGFEFLQISQADDVLASVPVLVATGSDHAEDEVKCLSLGAADFIPKPYNPPVVLGRLRSIIRLHESASNLAAVEYDQVSGALTRQAFILHGTQWMAREPEGDFHLLAASFENFRAFSAVMSSAELDRILEYLGSKLAITFPTAIVGRASVDCFALLTQREALPREEMLARLGSLLEDAPVSGVSMKFGAYEHLDTSLPMGSIIDCALVAAQAADDGMLVSFAYYDEDISRRMLEDQAMEAAFPQALAQGEFVPWFQPKYSVQGEDIIGAEALVRWVKPDGTRVSPGAFIPLFEKTGLIVQLDAYLFEQVCLFQKKRLDQGLPVVPVSVNASRATLMYPGVAEKYLATAQRVGIPFELVPLELTESMAVEDSYVADVLVRFAQAGFKLHLDDFGSGYSSLSSLCELPLSVLKIDKSLVDRIGTFQGNMLVKTAIVLASGFGLDVVAEGVESLDQVEFLRNTRCQCIQGFYYSAPKPSAEFEAMLNP